MARGVIPFACISITIGPTRLAYASAFRRFAASPGIRSRRAPSELLVNGNLRVEHPLRHASSTPGSRSTATPDTSGMPKHNQA